MIRFALVLALLSQTSGLAAQTPYFQQEVNYTIQATLNDREHTLEAQIRIEYINHSPDTLREIWMHLWANAYANRNTAFCRQKLREGSARFYFAPDSTLGFFKNLDFSADGQRVAWRSRPDTPDIAVLQLARPLPPNGRVVISTPFFLKIPASFSRLGHVKTSYQMTQWYPKPAVYDNRGWHAMPYLDMGEFYSEFGSYDVTITLPENYVVGATGVLQTASEWAFLQQKERETQAEIERRSHLLDPKAIEKSNKAPFPPSAATAKTLRFTAENVHDFAWFADKRFFVLKDTARLASGRTVDCWAMFTAEDFNLWQKGAFYVRRAVEFYSQHVGDYPWPQATAVHSALSAGGGMEYPMITVIGNESSAKGLDDVITHEVGHNWFYGILASNERDHPWMDEGINSYYEHRYMLQYYGSDTWDDMLPHWAFNTTESGSIPENGYLMLARQGADTPPDTPSDDFWSIAYGIQVYMKTAICLEWLERSIGKARFDNAMQQYYERWKFRHPYPEDVRTAWREANLEAEWFFQTMQTRRRFDVALTHLQRRTDGFLLTLKDRGSLQAPFSVTALRQGQPVQTHWYPALSGRTDTLLFPETDVDRFVVDYSHNTLDVNRKNNSRRTSGLFPGFEPLRVKWLAPAENPSRSTVGLIPWPGWNNYDKTMLGLLLYNPPFPPRRFQYFLLPGLGLGSGQFAGLADLKYRFLPGGRVPVLVLGLGAKTFDYDYHWGDQYYLRFYRLAPVLRAELRSKSPSFEHEIQLRTLVIGKEEARYDTTGFLGKAWQHATIYEARYFAQQHRLPNPYEMTGTLEWQNYRAADDRPAHYLRGSVEWKQQFYYQTRRKISVRLFAGYFFVNTQRQRSSVAGNSLSNDIARSSFALNPQGFNDYRFDQLYLGRSQAEGLFSQQVSQTEGGFKNAFGSPYAGQTGNSNNYILALNFKADLPQRLPLGIPLKPYFDLGFYDDATPLGSEKRFHDQFLWSGGFMLEFLQGGLEIYFPMVNAKPLRDVYKEMGGNNYLRRITWSIRIGRVTPMEVIRKLAN